MFNKKWFLNNQKLLKWFANTRYGKDLLGHDLDKVDLILPNAVVKKNLTTYTAEFRTHNKYAKRLFYEFQPIWKAFHWFDMNIANVYVPRFNLGFDSLTRYPDANPESTSVDGFVSRSGVNEAFSTIRAGAGVTANDSSASDVGFAQLTATSTSNQYGELSRGIFLFDTSALGGGTVSAAILSIYNDRKLNTLGSPEYDIVASTPASNTSLVAADYGQLGTTVFASATHASVTEETYVNFTLDSNGMANVSNNGVSKFGLRLNWDTDNSFGGSWVSAQTSGFYGYSADQTGTSQDPKLVITYTPAQAGYFHFM